MDSNASGSFIPKRAATAKQRRPVNRRIYLFSYLAYVIFFGTLLSVAGIFFLNQQAQSNLNELSQALRTAQENFNTEQLESLKALDQKIATAEFLLNQNLAPSRLFRDIEDSILQSIALNSFSYEKISGGAVINLKGDADDFDSVIFQRLVFSQSDALTDAVITDVQFGGSTGDTIGDGNGDLTAGETARENTISFVVEKTYQQSDLQFQPVTVEPTEETALISTSTPAESSSVNTQ